MTQSITTGSILTRNELIRQSFLLIGVLAEGQKLTGQQTIDAQNSLNRVVYDQINHGLQLWKYTEATLFLVSGQEKYTLSTSNVTESFVETDIAVDAVATDTTITVTDATGISDLDNIGIVLIDDTIQWTTVSGAPAGNVITLTDQLTDDASTGNAVFSYTDKILKPDEITQARRHETNGNRDVEMYLESRMSYFAQPNKKSTGTPVSWYYDKRLETGVLFLWQAPNREKDLQVRFTFQKPFFVFDSADDQADFPREYTQTLVHGLAYELCKEYGVAANRTAMIKQDADRHLDEALSFDREPASILLSPNLDQHGFTGGTNNGG